jgi:hypothetical protein
MKSYELQYAQPREHTHGPGLAIHERKQFLFEAEDYAAAERRALAFLERRRKLIENVWYEAGRISLTERPRLGPPAKLLPEFDMPSDYALDN